MRLQFAKIFIALLITTTIISCEKESTPDPVEVNSSFVEGFDLVSELPSRGWAFKNMSYPAGTSTWFQGSTVFNAQSSNLQPNSYIAANFNNVSGAATISNWMFSPAVEMKNGDQIVFYTRAATGNTFPERLQVRVNPYNDGLEVGNTSESVGDFGVLLRDINPTLTPTGYPTTWTKYTVPITGLAGDGKRRFSFRYYVTNGGTGANSNYIGVDSVAFIHQ